MDGPNSQSLSVDSSNLNITTADMMQAVREAAMLADVNIGVFSAERSDRAIMEKVKRDAGATGNVGRVVKNMFAGADEKLKSVRSAFAHVRTLHYENTLPWVGDPHAQRTRGPRLLPVLLFDRYLTSLSTQRKYALALLDEFIADLPDTIARARQNLGKLADTFYPDEKTIRGSFRVHFDFEPIPAGTEFKGLSEHMLERLSKSLQARQQRMLEGAQAHAWVNVRERLGHLVQRLADPEAKFKRSTLEAVQELPVLLRGWNLTGSGQMSEIGDDIGRLVGTISPDVLRDDATVRSAVVYRIRELIAKMDQWDCPRE
jgi:hypothetical protein